MKVGEKLTYAQVCERIRLAVASLLDDAADAARLHNLLAQGHVEVDGTDPTWDTYVCLAGDGCDDPPTSPRTEQAPVPLKRRSGALAPKLSDQEFEFFELVAAAARKHDLRALARLVNKAPTPRLRGHALATYAIHHAARNKNRRVALLLLQMAVAEWVDEWDFLKGIRIIRDVVENALSDPDFERKFCGDG